MRAKGVEEWRAQLMYFAVYHFGPRWEISPGGGQKPRSTIEPSIAEQNKSRQLADDLEHDRLVNVSHEGLDTTEPFPELMQAPHGSLLR